MKLAVSWLNEYVAELPSMDELASVLAISGTDVDTVDEFGVPMSDGVDPIDRYVTGHVAECVPHENADKLRVCQVDVGADELQQIVCGAPNVAAGQNVAVVLPGGVLPGGHAIGTAKLRGVESNGMILSERELGISEDHDGIMVLDGAPAPGTPLAAVLPIRDAVLELEITSNRPDCLGVYGVAREAAAALGQDLTELDDSDAAVDTAAGSVADYVTVHLDDPDLCQRYMARGFDSVQVGPSPAWLKQRLTAAGMRPINNVVDVTNYVMLLTGQPLHAFDAEQIGDATIRVRRATADEPITTLDDEQRTLTDADLVIADGSRPAVIAGIMGAADVEVHSGTTRIVLEAATFDGRTILETSHRLGLRSESSGRFEKGLPPQLPEVALRIASRMLVELCGARMASGTIDEQRPGGIEAAPSIVLDATLPARILGMELADGEVADVLGRLGYAVADAAAAELAVEVPYWRIYDTTRPIDLVEEVGRIAGLDRVPAKLPARSSALGGLSRTQRMTRSVEDALAAQGFREAITYTLRPAGDGRAAGVPDRDVVELRNPMTVNHAELRASLLPSLLEVYAENRRVGNSHGLWFERAHGFRQRSDMGNGNIPAGTERYADERELLTLVAGGTALGELGAGGIDVDAGMVRAMLDQALGMAGVPWTADAPGDEPVPPGFHPGKAARVLSQSGATAGWYGQLHPAVLKAHDLPATTCGAELDLDLLLGSARPGRTYQPISTYPVSRQDIAVILPDQVAAGALVARLQAAGVDDLESVLIFDRYAGEQVPAGHHSLALRLSFRAPDRTLEDAEVDARRAQVTDLLADWYGARLRD